MPADFNRITTSIRQTAYDLSPEFQHDLRLSNEIDWAFAILFGKAGHLQVPLVCSAAGVLSVADATTAAAIAAKPAVKIVDTAGVNQLKVDATNNLHASIHDGGLRAAVSIPAGLSTESYGLYVYDYYAKELHTILSDCYVPADHVIKVRETGL